MEDDEAPGGPPEGGGGGKKIGAKVVRGIKTGGIPGGQIKGNEDTGEANRIASEVRRPTKPFSISSAAATTCAVLR